MQKIIAILEQYKTQNGGYPSTAQGLAALSGLGAVPPSDAWGNPFSYVSPGVYAEFELQSYGADGVPGGIDENADITSWAQASLIGRWYEYTPTSALDIAFNETLPTA
jgi:type II secretory pathway pseudopilin PulG